MNSIWMNAWDLDGVSPSDLVDQLRSYELDTCSLGLSYHGGRMLMPRSPVHTVYEQDLSAVYFPFDPDGRLKPHIAPEAKLVPSFLEACRRDGFGANAWIVLCHNDRLGFEHPDCCIQNVFGERYTYALCPSHPDVRTYAVALCRDVAAIPGLTGIDLEACSFMGYAHGSLHDKAGLPLTDWVKWLLSICVCPDCRRALGPATEVFVERARTLVKAYFESFDTLPLSELSLRDQLDELLGVDLIEAVLQAHRGVIRTLLDDIRVAIGSSLLNLRLATRPLFCGGKSLLPWEDLEGRVDAVTVTFFGTSEDQMAKELNRLPPVEERPVPVYGGFIFHYPDCPSEEVVHHRLALLRKARLDGYAFYSLSMAANSHLRWLTNALQYAHHPLQHPA